MITPEHLISSARSWLGVPFLHQGRNRFGVDCAGLLVALLRDTGALPCGFKDARDYARIPNGELMQLVSKHCTPASGPENGGIVLIRWQMKEEPSHIGLIDGPDLIHCYQDAGGVVKHGYRGRWLRLTASSWRLPGVRYE